MRDSHQAMGANPRTSHELQDFEKILADNIVDVVDEICFADVNILIAYAAKQSHGNMNDLVASSIELFFKDQTLTYAHAADVNINWSDTPSVLLHMKFSHGPVEVSFKLLLSQSRAGLLIDQIVLDDRFSAEDFDSAAFDRVLNSARIKRGPSMPQNLTRH